MSNKFQTPPKRKHASETSCEEDEFKKLARPASLPAQATSPPVKLDAKSAISEPITSTGKLTVGSVSSLTKLNLLI